MRELALRVLRYGLRRLRFLPLQIVDRLRPTYQCQNIEPIRIVSAFDIDSLRPSLASYRALCDAVLSGKSDCLRDDWISVLQDGSTAAVNRSNRERSRKIWQGRPRSGQSCRRWQWDPASGFSWSAKTWYRDIPIPRYAGLEIKHPWERARGYELVWLATAHAAAKAGVPEFRSAESYSSEAEIWIRDFLAHNPPRFGVCWAIAMEAAIRGANIGLAVDLFRAHGARFSDGFLNLVATALHEHCGFIERNPEFSPKWAGNHYLAGVCALAIMACYLPESSTQLHWIEQAADAILLQLDRQFGLDGGNFEGSTAYHGLAAELIAFALAYLAGWAKKHPDSPISARVLSLPAYRISKLANFQEAVTRADGMILQVGDNDSGRLFKIVPTHSPTGGRWIERPRDHRAISAALRALTTGRPPDAPFGPVGHVILSTSQGGLTNTIGTGDNSANVLPQLDRDRVSASWNACPPEARYRIGLRLTQPHQNLDFHAFPNFGLFVWRRDPLMLSIRCGAIGQLGRGGHDHDDQLSITLYDRSGPVIDDPGSPAYQSDKGLRNLYRGADSHFAPCLDYDRATPLEAGPFELRDCSPGQVRAAGRDGFWGTIGRDEHLVHRALLLENDILLILDWAEPLEPNGHLRLSALPPQPVSRVMVSDGYGRITDTPAYDLRKHIVEESQEALSL